MTAAASACLVLAAFVVAWPDGSRRRRQRRLGLTGRRRAWMSRLSQPAASQAFTGLRPAGSAGRVPVRWIEGPAAPLIGGVPCGGLGLLLGGPVAGLVAGVYGSLAAWSVVRRRRRRAAARARAQALDALGGLAADLRAGALSTVEVPVGAPGRVGVALSLAAATGAPLADLLDRVEADARAADRVGAAAAAQRSGMHATAYLLAGLPIAGLALGHAIGADPVVVLLETPLGAACAVGALVLQLAGLLWSARIAGAGAARGDLLGSPSAGSTLTGRP